MDIQRRTWLITAAPHEPDDAFTAFVDQLADIADRKLARALFL